MSENLKVALISLAAIVAAVAAASICVYVSQNWHWLVIGHHPDTLRLRCEQEAGGVLVSESCFKKEAVIWPASEAPR